MAPFWASYNCAAALTRRASFLLLFGTEYGQNGLIKNGLQPLLSQGGTFQVALGSNLQGGGTKGERGCGKRKKRVRLCS